MALRVVVAMAVLANVGVASGTGRHGHRHKSSHQEQQLRSRGAIDVSAAAGGDEDLGKEMSAMLAAQKEAMTSPEAELKEQLAAYTWLEDQLLEKEDGLGEESYRGKIAIAEKAVAKDTSPGVASMLADMRREMHSLAAPFYRKVLDGQLKDVREKEHTLLAQIELSQHMRAGTNATANSSQALRRKTEAQQSYMQDGSVKSLLLMAVAVIVIVGVCTGVALLMMRLSRSRSDAPTSTGAGAI